MVLTEVTCYTFFEIGILVTVCDLVEIIFEKDMKNLIHYVLLLVGLHSIQIYIYELT